MIRGPSEYVPPVEVEVVARRKAIPLDENEGIYVRDIKTGRVRAVCGQTYMLTHDEELWEKDLPPTVEQLLTGGKDPLADRGTRNTFLPPELSKAFLRVTGASHILSVFLSVFVYSILFSIHFLWYYDCFKSMIIIIPNY